MNQDFSATFEDDFQAISNWAMTLPELPEKQLTEEEEKLINDFKESVEKGEPYIYPEDKEIWSDMLE